MKVPLGVFIIAVAATLQSACAGTLARVHLGTDLVLVAVLSLAACAGHGPALAAAAFAGLCKDSFSAGPFGASAAVFVALAFLVGRLRGLLWLAHWTTQSAIAFLGTLAAGALYALCATLRGAPACGEMGPLLVSAAVNACLAPACFRVWRAVLR